MTKKEFENLSNKELIKAIELYSNNADNLYRSAVALENSQVFSVANSLLILSLEESMKAYVCLGRIFEKKTIVDIPKFFSEHPPKIELAKIASAILIEVMDFINVLSGMVKEGVMNKDDFKNLDVEKELNYLKTNADKKRRSVEYKLITKWFKDANDNKKAGFYVDYKNKIWNIPEKEINPRLYYQSKEIVKKYLIYMRLMSWRLPNSRFNK